MKKLKELITDEQGQGMTEYGLVLGIIAVAVVGFLVTLRGEITAMFQDAVSTVQTRATGDGSGN
jgi:pilus assembly protein Flp/PilA